MLSCMACGSTNAASVRACAKCGASLAGAGTAGTLQASRDDALVRELDDLDRLKRRRRTHAIVGALTFFILILLFGLPHSLMPTELIWNAVVSTILGTPIGYLISRWNAGPIKGALISGAAMAVARVTLGLLSGESGGIVMGGLVGFAVGLLPGVLIGWHVEQDD